MLWAWSPGAAGGFLKRIGECVSAASIRGPGAFLLNTLTLGSENDLEAQDRREWKHAEAHFAVAVCAGDAGAAGLSASSSSELRGDDGTARF